MRIVSRLVAERFSNVLVATIRREDTRELAERIRIASANLVAVTAMWGNLAPIRSIPRIRATKAGVAFCEDFTRTMLPHGIDAAVLKKCQGKYPAYMVAQCLRIMCRGGGKVGMDAVAKAYNVGVIPGAIGVLTAVRTGRGAHRVAIIEAYPSDRLCDVRVRRIMANPL